MVMTFVLHSLSHYNSITEPRARFLLSLLEDISIDFPSHFILSLIDVYRDTATHDQLIFSSAIMQIIRHFSIPYLESDHFFIIGAIDVVAIRLSDGQLHPRRTQIETTTPPASLVPSTFFPSSSVGGVTLDVIMVRLQCMDACLDTLSDELYQVNIRVGHIARQQARLGGFVESPSPSLEASKEEDEDDDGDSDDDGDKDEDASSFIDDEMTA